MVFTRTLAPAPKPGPKPRQVCSGGAEPFALPADAPCDDRSTAASEACLQPSATLSGPATLLLCPGSGLSLTGGYTTGEGALSPRPPRFIWAAAEGSDNLGPISAHLATVHDASEVLELDAALLDGGDHFEFTLQVVDFVGQASEPATHTVTRLATPAPVVTIEAPAHVRLSAGELLLLPARAQLASCNGTDASVNVVFEWRATDAATGAVLTLPDVEGLLPGAPRSTLALRGAAPLRFGGTHLLRVTGCLGSAPSLCGSAEVRVTLRDSPLVARIAGGDRAVGEDAGLELDASSSADPDEPSAALQFVWSCSTAAADADADTAAATHACPQLPPAGSSLALPPGELRPGRYVFAVSVSKASGETASGETASAGVAITVVAGSVPVVSVAPPAAAKQSANTALRLVGSASLDSASASQLELAWSCDGES